MPRKKQKRMPAVTETRSRSPESENGSVAKTATGVEATQEAVMEAMEATQEDTTVRATQDTPIRSMQEATEESKRTIAVNFLKTISCYTTRDSGTIKIQTRGRPYGINFILKTTWTRLPVRDGSLARRNCKVNK